MLAGERYMAKEREISRFFIATKYNKVTPSLARTLHEHWLAIESDPQLYSKFKIPPMVSYTKHKALRTIVKNKVFACPRLTFSLSQGPLPLPINQVPRTSPPSDLHVQIVRGVPRLLRHAVIRSRSNHMYPIDTSLTCN